MKIRHILESDKVKLLELFCNTINTVNLGDYSEKQVKTWGSMERVKPNWDSSFKNKEVFVAQEADKLLGFCELESNGYIDRFYVAADSVGKGVGRNLFEALEISAKSREIEMLFSNASITAKPFFEKLGFSVVAEQKVFIKDIEYTNYRVEKILN
mgnify:CR=1 FL=1